MFIGIDASRAFLRGRTGIEEYAYQTIWHLRDVIPETDTVILYVRKKVTFADGRLRWSYPEINFALPKHWRVRGIWAPRFWTQGALSLEMFLKPPDVLFVPAHTVPFVHPKKTVVTIHGLEYEFCKGAYSFWERLYMRFSIRFSGRAAEMVICVSQNTKRDVMRLYGVSEKKIRVIYEGYERAGIKNQESRIMHQIQTPYLLFIGRLEERKNIVKIIEAFEILKEQYSIAHQLALVGKPGFGYKRIMYHVSCIMHRSDVIELGYVTAEEKWELLRNADVFLFPTLYEGFGIPVLEAQSAGVAVVTSENSSLPEVAGKGAVYVDPLSAESIALGIWKILSNTLLREDIVEQGRINVSRFSWKQCARETADVLLDK